MALEGAEFSLVVRPLGELRPHEQVIPAHVESLSEEISRDGVQKDPILIESKYNVVLDGMHRLAAFGKLGIRNAVCCTVDYRSPSVALDRWARVYVSRKTGDIETCLKELGMTRRSTFGVASRELDERTSGLAAITEGEVLLPVYTTGLGAALMTVAELDRLSLTRGWERRFVPGDQMAGIMDHPGSALVLVERLTKEDVVEAATSGRLFPCKTSMHSVDPRPVAVNFPVAGLNEASTESLAEFLSNSKRRVLAPGSTYGGRKYKERLLLLNQR